MEIFYTLPGTSKYLKQLKHDHIAITIIFFSIFICINEKDITVFFFSLYVKTGYSEQAPLKQQAHFVLDF